MVAVFVIAGVAVLAALVALHWYGWRRLVRDTTAAGSAARRIGTAVFIAGPALMVAAPGSGRAGAPFWLQQIVAWPGYLWMAFFIYVSLALVVGEAVRPLLRRFLEQRDVRRPDTGSVAVPAAPADEEPALVPHTGESEEAGADAGRAPDARTAPPAPTEPAAPASPAAPGPSRRLFVSRVVGGAAAAAAVATVGAGAQNVLGGPAVKRVTVPLARLPRRAHGFRIAVVSDIHLGPVLGRGHTQRIVDTINSTQPDLVAVVGDLVDGSVADLGPAAEPLAQLKSRHGSFFVTGNHEYISDAAEEWVEHVRELGLHPLENARLPIGDFDLAGVNDISGEDQNQGPDYAKALGDRDTSRASVLLAHQPVMIHDAVKHGVDLQLSGHTHGGQMWPGNIIADLANPTLAGLERYGDTQLYVTRGAGAWGPPVRVGAPSDITVVTLASRQA
ncbi:putative metallophosphoesterase [Streptomyces sp. YIM 130001]|uniref:metallophosphoesterase n=1 Tax=Streptomyces sp. YIM 130001 TaxID=2259644 RepID=UPI000E65A013|nr:metallophosphoesterase [Streptomyces sp. YIM 130001]RII20818.1 putative metallophosphoesterase [Streptomyces sp. YIM 130001]